MVGIARNRGAGARNQAVGGVGKTAENHFPIRRRGRIGGVVSLGAVHSFQQRRRMRPRGKIRDRAMRDESRPHPDFVAETLGGKQTRQGHGQPRWPIDQSRGCVQGSVRF